MLSNLSNLKKSAGQPVQGSNWRKNWGGLWWLQPLPSMCGVTDIPDWDWNEGGLPYLWGAADPATLDLMWSKSPISHVGNVTAPVYLMIGGKSFCFLLITVIVVFLLLPGRAHPHWWLIPKLSSPGKNDLRVPPSQGYEYYHALKVNFVVFFSSYFYRHFSKYQFMARLWVRRLRWTCTTTTTHWPSPRTTSTSWSMLPSSSKSALGLSNRVHNILGKSPKKDLSLDCLWRK